MYTRAHAGLPYTEFFVTVLALYTRVLNSVLVEVDHVGWSLFVKNSAQAADVFRGTWPSHQNSITPQS